MQNMMGIRTQIAEVNTVLTKPNRFPRQSFVDGEVCKYLVKLLRRQSILPIIAYHVSFNYYKT